MTLREEFVQDALLAGKREGSLGSMEIVITPQRFAQIYYTSTEYEKQYKSANLTHDSHHDYLRAGKYKDWATFAAARAEEWRVFVEDLRAGNEPLFPTVYAIVVPASGWRFGRIPKHEEDLLFVAQPVGPLLYGMAIEKKADYYKYQNPTAIPTTAVDGAQLFRTGLVPRSSKGAVIDRTLELRDDATFITHSGEKKPVLKIDRTKVALDRPVQQCKAYNISSAEGLTTNQMSKILPSSALFPTKPLSPSILATLGDSGIDGLLLAQF